MDTRFNHVLIGVRKAVLATVVMGLMVMPVYRINAVVFPLITDYGVAADQIALGNVMGFSTSANGIFENPASLYRSGDISLAAFSSKIMSEVHYTNIAISSVFLDGRIGVGVMQSTVVNIPETSCPSNACGFGEVGYPELSPNSFDYNNAVYKLGYQEMIRRQIQFGANLSYYTKDFYTVYARGVNLDLGIIYLFHNRQYEMSVLIKNIVPNQYMKYNTGELESLRAQRVLTLRRSFRNGLEVYPQIQWYCAQIMPSFGVKYRPNFFPYVQFLGGYRTALDTTLQRHNTMTVGLGIQLANLTINYAFERSDYVLSDHKNYLSMTVAL